MCELEWTQNGDRPSCSSFSLLPVRVSHSSRKAAWSCPQLLEHEPRHQINGVVSAGVATSSVIVCAAAIETRVAGVLRGQADVLLRPPGDVQNVSSALRAAVRTARDRRL